VRGFLTARGRRLVAAGAVATALLGAGCGAPRNSLGTAASPCFRALPGAQTAVRRKGRLVGVRRITTATLRRRFPNNSRVAGISDKYVCVFAFKGDYRPGDVELAVDKQSGPYAVVAVTSKGNEVITAFVLPHLPTRFRHSH
jgi:hypothetical protein